MPVALENIVLTAMAKNPDARYASADDMRADLARFRRGEQTSSVPLTAVPVSGADVTVVNPQMDKVYDRTTVGTVVPSQAIPVAPRRSAAPFVLVLVALLAVLAGLGYLLAKQLSDDDGGGDLITVGNYVGKTEEVARELIEADELEAEITTEENEQFPVGQVFAQEPPEGNKLEEGETVKLQVSGGKGQVRVPDVAGESLDDAQSRLPTPGSTYRRAAGDQRLGRPRQGDPHRTGRRAHRPTRGSDVKLFVSLGKEQVEVPDVAGQDPVEAANTLGARGLTVERVDQASDTVDDGHGDRHRTRRPAAPVAKGSKVQLIISSGKEQVRVPNVVGLSRSDATTELQNAGFKVVVREVTSLDPPNAGRVIAQSPSLRLEGGQGLRRSRSAWASSARDHDPSSTTTHDVVVPVTPGAGAPIARWYARPRPPRPALAGDPGPVGGAGVGGDAPADPGGPGGRRLAGRSWPASPPRRPWPPPPAGRGHRRLGDPRLSPPGPTAVGGGRADRRRRLARRPGRAARRRPLHRRRGRRPGGRARRPGRRDQHPPGGGAPGRPACCPPGRPSPPAGRPAIP